jgi:hypothetical protein
MCPCWLGPFSIILKGGNVLFEFLAVAGVIAWIAGLSKDEKETGSPNLFPRREDRPYTEFDLHSYNFRIKGTYYDETRKSLSYYVSQGDKLTYRRVYDNSYDSNAIEVHCANGSLGWVPKELALVIGPKIDKEGMEFSIIVTEIVPRSDNNDIFVNMVPRNDGSGKKAAMSAEISVSPEQRMRASFLTGVSFHAQKAEIFSKSKNHREAIYHFKKAIRLGSEDENVIRGLVKSYSDTEDYSRCADVCELLMRVAKKNEDIVLEKKCLESITKFKEVARKKRYSVSGNIKLKFNSLASLSMMEKVVACWEILEDLEKENGEHDDLDEIKEVEKEIRDFIKKTLQRKCQKCQRLLDLNVDDGWIEKDGKILCVFCRKPPDSVPPGISFGEVDGYGDTLPPIGTLFPRDGDDGFDGIDEYWGEWHQHDDDDG